MHRSIDTHPTQFGDESSGAEQIVECFIRRDVDRIFLFPGGTIGPILDVIERKKQIDLICARNEQGAGYAAIAHAKLTGKPAIYMVTSGPGVTNAVTPIADAYFDNIPLLVFTGQVATTDLRKSLPIKQRGFQEVDTVDIMSPITKKSFLVTSASSIPKIVEEAFVLSNSGRKGPVLIDIPMDLQRAVLKNKEYAVPEMERQEIPSFSCEKIATLADLICTAKRPIILAGGGIIQGHASDELRRLAQNYLIPVATSLPGVGAYPTKDKLSLGLCGYAGSQYCNLAIFRADLLLGIGTTFHVRQTGSISHRVAPQGRIARIDIDEKELAHSRVPVDLAIHGDARLVLQKLLTILGRPTSKMKLDREAWLHSIQQWKEIYPLTYDHGRILKPQYIIELVDSIVSDSNVIVTTGVGQHQIWVPRHFHFDFPRRQLLTSSGHGTMGFDLPVSIGAQISRPDATVICFVGDGSFQMNIQELAMVTERNLPIKIIVLDNKSLNIVAQFQRQNWKTHPTTGDKYNPDFAAIGKAYGILGYTIRTPNEAMPVLSRAFSHKGPVVVHCHVDPGEDLLPMLLSGHTLDDMSFERSS